MNLQSATVMVTGSGRGIGRVIAKEFAAQGAKVVVVFRTVSDIEDVAREINEGGGAALSIPADVTCETEVQELVKRVEKEFGSVDVLVNNAAMARSIGPLHMSKPDVWIQDVQVNLIGVYLCLHAVLPGMIDRQRGYVINMIGGDAKPLSYLTAYNASKTGVMRLTETLALELADTGVKVFGMSPGFVHTSMTDYTLESEDGKQWQAAATQRRLDEGRDVSPDYAAKMAVALTTGKLDALTGRAVRADKDDLDVLAQMAEEIVLKDERVLRSVGFPE